MADPDPSPLKAESVAEAPGWQLVAAPGNDLPAALAGTIRPDVIWKATQDLNQIIAEFNRWLHDICTALLVIDDQANRQETNRSFSTFDSDLWLTGAHRLVHKDSPLLRELDTLTADLVPLAEGLCLPQEPSDAVAGGARQQRWLLFRDLFRLGEGLRQLFVETWVRLTNVDPLTGLGNRPAMLRRLAIECERHQRNQQPCCVAVIDCDNFKEVNDQYGHRSGDTVLRSIASLLAAGVRPYDEVFRYGGDEFVLCLPSADPRTAWAVVERLRLKIANWTVPLKGDHGFRITVSIGVAPLTASRGVEGTLDLADKALYAAKHTGRNSICVRTG